MNSKILSLAKRVGYSQGRIELREKVLAALRPIEKIEDLTDGEARTALIAILQALADSITEEGKLDD